MQQRLLAATLLTLIAGLLTGVSTSAPAEAAGVRVQLFEPKLVGVHKARLEGRVRGREAVQIQRYATVERRWVGVKRVRAGRNNTFRTTVRVTQQAVHYRAVAGGVRSRVRTVVARTPQVHQVFEDECGARPRKADGSLWSCTLNEEFNGAELDRNIWRPQVGFNAGSLTGMPCYVDDPGVISVHDGALHLSVREVSIPVIPCPGLILVPTNHIAGGVDTYWKWSQKYGRFETRYKNTAATVPGLHEAFWLWPDARHQKPLELWPAAGEIDITETYSQHPDLAIPFLHYGLLDNLGPQPGLNTAWDCRAARGRYNTYTLEWTANRIEIFVNGRSCLVNTSGDEAFRKPYIMALTQMLGAEQNGYRSATPLPATMTVDYVRVWE